MSREPIDLVLPEKISALADPRRSLGSFELFGLFAVVGTFGAFGLFMTAGCGLESQTLDPAPGTPIPGTPIPGTPAGHRPGTVPDEGEKARLERVQILAELQATEDLSSTEFLKRYEVSFGGPITYSGRSARNLDLIQQSSLALQPAELDALDANGFVIAARHHFPSFLFGYEALYAQDLPLYVSADSVLHALHSSYDEILKALEYAALIPELQAMLSRMRENLASGMIAALGPNVEADVDLYLAVGASLLGGTSIAPVKGADPRRIQKLLDSAILAQGVENLEFLGTAREMDFSQFTPRGHYNDSEELQRYFRAMMWLGRIDLRLIETQPDHSQVFRRRQFDAALAIYGLMDPQALARWTRIDAAIEAFVGESDNMTLHGFGQLFADLGVDSVEAIAALPDRTIEEALVRGDYGAQRISSHVMRNGLDAGTMPLSRTFLLLGQRYVLDSHVFSNLVYDRVQRGRVKRMMPDALDVAFAALGNDQAASLLKPALDEYSYASDLHAMRFLADTHGEAFWESNLYNLWLSALRTLSPDSGASSELPAIATTEAWGRRMLNTQLASWAELRHDTILYAKQSYTGGTSCEFPDAYVDPYPAFYRAIGAFATRALEVVQAFEFGARGGWLEAIDAYFLRLRGVTLILTEMAEHQRSGTPFTADHLAFINRAVHIHSGCGSVDGAEGWFADLYFNTARGAEYDPTIADVHTQPTDEVGNLVGRVLHVGTGGPELMVVAIETCQGVRAYAGLVSTYYEKITDNFDRLTDERWQQMLHQEAPPRARWMSDLVIPR